MAGEQNSFVSEQDIDLDNLLPPDPDDKKDGDAEASALDVEVVDDTPEQDRGRERLKENPEPTEEELEEYSEKVQKRIKKLQHGYHDERRAKERAERERDEALRAAQAVWQQMQTVQGRFAQSEEVAVKELRSAAENKLKALKEEIKRAYNEGDAEKIADLTEQVADEKLRLKELSSYQPQFTPQQQPQQQALQPAQNAVYTQQPAPQEQRFQPDDRAEAWRRENSWFGKDRKKTAFAMGVHESLVLEEGIDPAADPDTYYRELNKQLREAFPDLRAGDQQTPERRQSTVPVAGVSRGSGTRGAKTKVQLTASQAAIADRLGVPREEYARQMMMLQRGQ